MTQSVTYTHCHICEQLCGLAVTAQDGQIVAIRPDKQNPYSWRDFCVKAQRAGEVVHSPWRLRSPMRREGSRFVAATYDEAVADIAKRLTAIIASHGPNAVGGYLGNPGGFNFGAGAFHNGLLEAIGTHQAFSMFSIDTNAHHAAAGRMFGLEWLALIPDVDAADCVLMLGSNPAVSKLCWLGKVPNGWRRLRDSIRNGADLIVVDPRRTETAEAARTHLAPFPESDWAFLLGVVKVILNEGLGRLPPEKIDGLEELRALADGASLEELGTICGIEPGAIADAALRFGRAKSGFVFAATGPGLGRNGSIANWLVLALNLLTDRIDRPGGRYMPNWPMSMAIFKAQMAPDSTIPSRVRGLAPVVGMHSIAELSDEILTPGEGQLRALFMTGGNPVNAAADGTRMAGALKSLDLLVAVDLFQRESHRDAHWLIPGDHFLERDDVHAGIHVLNDRPFIQSARAAVPRPDGVWPEWRFFKAVAEAMGLSLFGGQFEAHPDAVAASMLAVGGQVTLEEIRAAKHGLEFGERTLGHLWAYLRSVGATVHLCPADLAQCLNTELERHRAAKPTPAGAYQIISRRRNGMMNSWLAETSGNAPPDPVAEEAELSREDALREGIHDGEMICLRSDTAEVLARVRVSDQIRPGVIVLAHGWGSPLFDPSSGAEVARRGVARNTLVSDSDLDPLSAVPRLNGTSVDIRLHER